MALIIGVVIVLLILFGFLCYKKAPPTEAIVVTGFGLARPKVVCGKGTFVLPVLQRADRLNMRLLKIDVKTPETGVKTQNGVSLWIDSVVTIQVYSENSTVLDEEVKASGLKDAKAYIMSRQQAAISNFLGMNEQGINDKVNDVLQGNLREIVSDMTVDQILTNRKQMALSVIENARPDLAKMGLEVVTFNVQDIRDAIDGQGHNHGVIEAIGIEQEELVKKQAEIARAQAARDVACAMFQLRHRSKQFLEYDTGRRESVLIQENSAVIRRPKGQQIAVGPSGLRDHQALWYRPAQLQAGWTCGDDEELLPPVLVRQRTPQARGGRAGLSSPFRPKRNVIGSRAKQKRNGRCRIPQWKR